MKLVFGEGSCGIAAGARKVRAAVEKLNADGAVGVGITGCIGMCYLEPIVDVYDGGTLVKRLVKVDEAAAPALYEAAKTGDLAPLAKYEISADDREFLEKQTRIALRHCGLIDPEDIAAYEAVDGYKAIRKVLAMTPEEVIAEIKVSGLAGRGGAGFPTWFKWNAARNAKGEQKYLICNADEGDPGAFMDRAVIESDPHSLIEGMLIAAYAIGATKAFVYVRAEYPLAIVRLEKALAAAKKAARSRSCVLRRHSRPRRRPAFSARTSSAAASPATSASRRARARSCAARRRLSLNRLKATAACRA